MINPVLILSRNNLELTKRAVRSARGQDIETEVYVVDNGSEDGTEQWLENTPGIEYAIFRPQIGVSAGWNWGLDAIFADGSEYALVIGNDTVIPSWFYRHLLAYNVPFITGTQHRQMEVWNEPKVNAGELTPNPDFSAFLIRREAWEQVGKFNEEMVYYVQDCDMHVRAHRMGLPMWKTNAPYFHEGSATMNNAEPLEQSRIRARSNADRAVFKMLYGCEPGTPEYAELFK